MSMDTIAKSWLLAQPQAKDSVRLFCFPYAGGGASIYRGWARAFPSDVGVYPVQLPGRENRIAERAYSDMGALVEELAQVIHPYLDRPFLFFGHSMGTRIAFELARTVRSKWGRLPLGLIVSGGRAPHFPEPKPIYHLPEDEFVAALRRFSGTPEAILQSKELMQLFMPLLRADFTLDETYVFAEEPRLDCPIAAYCGTEDQEATQEEMEAWASHTSAGFTLEMVNGGHFFLTTNKDVLLQSVTKMIGHYRSTVAGKGEH
ncbi:alpha/beta fold hydrolase [Brevibacillus formosus]|uniref:thioesterase II family protein n=1 Tax=Brevibacillus formosus TaxID=54913 RepID=UPI0018CE164C|nr:alpha/beta fold hydrolase [Brevibacillus formosus]MBG9943087.1 gramicidin dehydrogenase [Brevibacillus formosus]